MAVTETDVLTIAKLARLRVDHEQLSTVAAQLNAILGHMEALTQIDTSNVASNTAVGNAEMPLRGDVVAPLPMQSTATALTTQSRDGFILVPRLSTHGDA